MDNPKIQTTCETRQNKDKQSTTQKTKKIDEQNGPQPGRQMNNMDYNQEDR